MSASRHSVVTNSNTFVIETNYKIYEKGTVNDLFDAGRNCLSKE